MIIAVCFAVSYFRQFVYVGRTCLIDELITLSSQTNNKTLKESCYGLACLYYARLGKSNKIRKLSKKARPGLVTESYRQLIQKMILDNKVEEALNIALSIEDQNTKSLCLATIQRHYSIIGDYDRAFDISQKISRSFRFWVIRDVLVFQFVYGNKTEAVNSLRTLESYKSKIKILNIFAQLYNSTKNIGDAKTILKEAESYLVFLENEHDKIECLIDLTETKFKLGLITYQDTGSIWQETITKITMIDLSNQKEHNLIKIELLKNLIKSQAATGHFTLAKNTTDSIIKQVNLINNPSFDENRTNDYLLSDLAYNLSDYGLWECILKLLNEIKDITFFADCFKNSLEKLYTENHIDAALELLKQTQTQSEYISNLFFDKKVIETKIVMYAYIAINNQTADFDLSHIINNIFDIDIKVKVLSRIALGKIKSGDSELAYTIIEHAAEQLNQHPTKDTIDTIRKKITLLSVVQTFLSHSEINCIKKFIDKYCSKLNDKNIYEIEIQFVNTVTKSTELILENEPEKAKKELKRIVEILTPKIFYENAEIVTEYVTILTIVYFLLADSFLKSENISELESLSTDAKLFVNIEQYYVHRLVQIYAKSGRFHDANWMLLYLIDHQSDLYRIAVGCLAAELIKHDNYTTALHVIRNIKDSPNDIKIDIKMSVLALACENLFPLQNIDFLLQKTENFENKIDIKKYILSPKAIQASSIFEYE